MSVDNISHIEDSQDSHSASPIVPRIPYICTIYTLLILGLVGNTLVFILMQHAWFRQMSYSVYLRCLAVSDTLYLLINCTEDILQHQFGVLNRFLTAGLYVCVPWDYVKNVSRYTSPWLIIALTADRCVAVVMPLKRSIYCSLKTARAVSAGIILYAMLETVVIAIHETIFVHHNETKQCEPLGNSVFNNYVYVRIFLLESTLPCFLILILNINTIVAIRRSYKARQALSDSDNNSRSSSVERVTVSLVAVSFMAFCTLVPKATAEVIELFWAKQYERDLAGQLSLNGTELSEPSKLQLLRRTWPLLNLISTMNFCQNFYIMVATGPRYRQAIQLSWHTKGCCRKGRWHKDSAAGQGNGISMIAKRFTPYASYSLRQENTSSLQKSNTSSLELDDVSSGARETSRQWTREAL